MKKLIITTLGLCLGNFAGATNPPVKDTRFERSQAIGVYYAVNCMNNKGNSNHGGQTFQPIDPRLEIRENEEGGVTAYFDIQNGPTQTSFNKINEEARSSTIVQDENVQKVTKETYTFDRGFYKYTEIATDPHLDSGSVDRESHTLSFAGDNVTYEYLTTAKKNSDDRTFVDGYGCRYRKR